MRIAVHANTDGHGPREPIILGSLTKERLPTDRTLTSRVRHGPIVAYDQPNARMEATAPAPARISAPEGPRSTPPVVSHRRRPNRVGNRDCGDRRGRCHRPPGAIGG